MEIKHYVVFPSFVSTSTAVLRHCWEKKKSHRTQNMTWCDISTVSLTLSKICLCIAKCFRDISDVSRDGDVCDCHSRNEGILVMTVWWGLGCYGYELWLWGSFMNRLQFYLLNHPSTVFNHEQRHTWEQCSLWFIILMTHVVHYSNKKVITL